jgi:DNA-binding GntR family transcriptional regulator
MESKPPGFILNDCSKFNTINAMAGLASSSVPLHHQIAQVLRLRIESGRWGGGPLTEQALCEEFQVSRTTLRQALAQLKQAGLLQSRRGVGTHGVAPPARKVVRSSGNPLHASLNTKSRIHALGLVPAPGQVAAFLGIPQGGAVFRIVRVHELDGAPLSVVDSYLPARFATAFTRRSLRDPVHELLWRRFKVRQHRSVHAIRVARADTEVAGLLGVALADPVLRVHSSVYLADGKPIRWIENFFREERYEYVAEMDWPHPGKAARR